MLISNQQCEIIKKLNNVHIIFTSEQPLVRNESKSTNLNDYEVIKMNQISHSLISFHFQ